MSVISTLPTSRRGYLSRAELAQFSNISITDDTEADDRISQAEEMIDAYVGYIEKFMEREYEGRVSAAGSNTFTLQSDQQNTLDVNYFQLCEVEILGGTGAGQRRKITGSTRAGVITVDTAWATSLDTTSFYKIYQLGKFPRCCDVTLYSTQSPTTYYKQIPEAVKRAVAAQVDFIIEMGDSYFSGDNSIKQSESIGDYSYSMAQNGATYRLISSRTKDLLRGYTSRIGRLVV